MSETFATRAPCITVAVGFDKHTIPLVRYAAHLCQKLGKELCLLHVVEPWLNHPHSTSLGDNDPLWNVTQAVETNANQLAKSKLDELAQEVAPQITVRKKVVSGKALPTLCEEALKLESMLLLVGADVGNLKFLPKGLSTALSLLISSPVPVLVADGAEIQDAKPQNLKILVADDLSSGSENALELAFDLAIASGRSTLHHIHVSGITFDALEAGLVTAASTTHSPLGELETTEVIFDSLMSGLEKSMTARCEAQREYLEAGGGTYHAEVLSGPVPKMLQDYIDQIKPDIVLFGRHQTYHRQPFFIGRVPFRTMLASRIPTVVAPAVE